MPTAHIPEKSGDLLSVASQESQAQGNNFKSSLKTLEAGNLILKKLDIPFMCPQHVTAMLKTSESCTDEKGQTHKHSSC